MNARTLAMPMPQSVDTSTPMREFLDLPGQSGSTYRYRLWREQQAHQPIAGNYVFVASGDEGLEVLVVGETNDLSRARGTFEKAKERGASHVYTRLNVARAVREAEHEDVLAAHPRAKAERSRA